MKTTVPRIAAALIGFLATAVKAQDSAESQPAKPQPAAMPSVIQTWPDYKQGDNKFTGNIFKVTVEQK